MGIKSSRPVPRRPFPDAGAETEWLEAMAGAFRGVDPGSTTDRAWLFLERGESATAEVEDGREEWIPTRTCGLALSTCGDDRVAYRSEPRLEDPGRLARAGFAAGFLAESAEGTPPAHTGTMLPESGVVLRLLDRAAREAAGRCSGAAVRASWSGFVQHVIVAGAEVSVVTDRRATARLRVELSREGGRTARAVAEAVLDPSCGSGDEERALALGREVASRAEQRVDPGRIAPGDWPVVLGAGVSGLLAHEVVGHALEADVARAGLSWLAPGDVAGKPDLTVIDDPRRGRAAWRRDDEGHEARATPLIHRGRVVGRMHDTQTARLDAANPTGHGRRSSYRDPVRPRMGCTFIAAGHHGPEEALEGIALGVYVRRMEPAHTETRSGRAVFRVTDADRIVDSRIERSLPPLLLVVDGRRALAAIDRVASDLAFDTCLGTCVRDGQPLVASVGGPTIRIGLATVVPANGAR